MNHSIDSLRKLAQSDSNRFIQLLSSTKDVHVATMGAEILGEELDEEIALPILMKLTRHINAIIREGALIGISALFYGKNFPPEIIERLIDISRNDPSTTLREYSKELLDFT